MKHLAALALILMTTSSFAFIVGNSNNMGAEQAPTRRDKEPNAVIMRDANTDKAGINDTISTGQSSTRRDQMDAATKHAKKCVNRSGYSFYKHDSGYAACVNQNANEMKRK